MNLQERQQFWQQQVNTWQTTGLSGAAFCKQQGLNYQQFIYWRKKKPTARNHSQSSRFCPGYTVNRSNQS